MVSSCSCPKGYVCKCVKTRKKAVKKAKVVAKPQKDLPTVNKERQEDKERLQLLKRVVEIAKETKDPKDIEKATEIIQKHAKDLSEKGKKSLKGLSGDLFEDIADLVGKGKEGDGLYDSEIDELMKSTPSYSGTIAADEMDSLPVKDKMCFVMNTDNSNEPGRHWVAVYIDKNKDKEVNYYDPFGDPPTNQTLKGLKQIVDKMDPDTLLKFKINSVKNQDVNSDTCGWHSMNFLKERSNGSSFKEATGFESQDKQDNSSEREQKMENIKKQAGFGYI